MNNDGNLVIRKSCLMKILLKAASITLFLSSLLIVNACSKDIPMKTFTNIDIPDGEFLHYGYFRGGEKYLDYYIVTKKTMIDNKLYYRIYENVLSPAEN